MPSKNATSTNRHLIHWTLVILYSVSLPEVIFAYRKLSAIFPARSVSNIPVILLLLMGFSYLLVAFKNKRPFWSYIIIVPCLAIYLYIKTLQPYPNKHIHIPEYAILAWLVYWAASIDYEGRGILLLVFVCSSLLGCVDEILQGIHPARFYGWKDMLINTLSVAIGISTIIGLKDTRSDNWNWIYYFKRKNSLVFNILLGASGSAFTLYYLFHLTQANATEFYYPSWLVLWNCLFVIISCWNLVRETLAQNKFLTLPGSSTRSAQAKTIKTALLWAYCLIIPFVVINGLAALVVICGFQFK